MSESIFWSVDFLTSFGFCLPWIELFASQFGVSDALHHILVWLRHTFGLKTLADISQLSFELKLGLGQASAAGGVFSKSAAAAFSFPLNDEGIVGGACGFASSGTPTG
ncbi:hypothetical protein HED49_06835 [Ochrobactrum daejeonense]|nr:hypothetical protein [Brucella daejeonensis]